MKALTISQPYADLIINGVKIIELRKWNTNFRGKFLVHSSGVRIDKDECKIRNMNQTKLIRGAIIGKVTLIDVKKYTNMKELMKDKNKWQVKFDVKKWAKFPMYGFVLNDSQRFKKPIKYKGNLGFWNCDNLKT
ncbi:MAG: ASCH domain-containing protein [Nanoarchaeota archaeon]|nr:ASCH domain-containing protein [Nanoarchaeota archaeon]